MIDTGGQAPAWLKELSRFVALKNMLFIDGNILDIVSFSFTRDGSKELKWTENSLNIFFKKYFCELKYEIVGFVDPVDDISFCQKDQRHLFNKLAKGKQVEAPGESQGKVVHHVRSSCSEKDKPKNKNTAHDGPNLQRTMEDIRAVMANDKIPAVFIFNLVSRLISNPSAPDKAEQRFFTSLLKASLDAAEVFRGNQKWQNLMVIICDKLNDLPVFLYLNNPRARSIHLAKPDSAERKRFINRSYNDFYQESGVPQKPNPEITSLFAAHTESMSYYEMNSLISLSRSEKIPLEEIARLCEMFKYGISESEWDKIGSRRLNAATGIIQSRVKGQEAAVATVLDIIKRAKSGLAAGSTHKPSRPRGVLFFAGPTGVGKTETAKALAEVLFGNEDRCIRFDMSEYASSNADQRLMGAPPGYVGYQQGGQLTNSIKERPFSILLFDEIEKAHHSIFDKFLQILDDGRLTDGKGETAYFSESIIIFTSNLGVNLDERGNREPPYQQLKEDVLLAIQKYFSDELKRPEILNRFGDSFVVFDYIRPPVDREIVRMLVRQLCELIFKRKKLSLVISPETEETLVSLASDKLKFGGRGIRNVVDTALINPLSRMMFDQTIKENTSLYIERLIDRGQDSVPRFELVAGERP